MSWKDERHQERRLAVMDYGRQRERVLEAATTYSDPDLARAIEALDQSPHFVPHSAGAESSPIWSVSLALRRRRVIPKPSVGPHHYAQP